MKDGRESPSLHLDLSNFEDGVGSRYVLTSPRSLEACARLGVRPVELLHKSLEEVREENPEAGGQRLEDLYVAQEVERRHKLEMCRELRMELVRGGCQPDRDAEGHKDGPPIISPDQRNPSPPYTDHWEATTRDHKDSPSPFSPGQRNPSPPYSDHWVPQETSTRGLKDWPSTVSPGHTPPLSTDHRDPEDLLARGRRTYSPLPSHSQRNPSSSYSDHWETSTTDQRDPPNMPARGRRNYSSSPLYNRRNPPPRISDRLGPPDMPERGHNQRNHSSPSRDHLETSTRGHKDCPSPISPDHRDPPDMPVRGCRNYSPIPSHNPQNPSSPSRDHWETSTRVHKDGPSPNSPDQRTPPPLFIDRLGPLDKPLRGCRNYSTLRNQRNPSSPSSDPWETSTRGHKGGTLWKSLSQGDLFQMEEKARRMARPVEKELWASVSDRDKKIGALMLLKHQEEEMTKQRRQQAQQAWANLKTEERYIRAALDRQDWLIQRQNNRRRSWSSQLDWQMDPIHMGDKTLLKYGLTKTMADMKSKNTYQDNPGSHPLEERMIKAFKAKMIKELQDKKNIQIKNEYEKLRHAKLKEKVDNQLKAEERIKRASIRQKEQRSQELQEKAAEQRNKGLYEKASREDELKLMAKLRAMRLEKEQAEHKKLLARLSDHKIRQATDAQERSVLGKAERARELNLIKESTHQALKKKVEREKENQRKETADVIRMKDLKSNKIRKEKEATVDEGRRIARASFHFRDKIRQQTKSRTFDQMALQATLNASLLKTIP